MSEESTQCDIFISYRRQGGREVARTLNLALAAMGYEHIFFDFNSLRDGLFNEKILEAINVCKDFILVLSPGSMDRCVNEEDWVRTEISAAIDAGCNIVPVTIDDNGIVFPEDFPRKFNSIKRLQQSKLRTDEFFDDSVRRISERLESPKRVVQSKKSRDEGAFVLTARSDETCELYIEGERYSKIKAGKFTRVTVLKPGEEYKLTFRSLANRKDAIERTYRCPKISKADEIAVSFVEYRESLMKEDRENRERLKRERSLHQVDKENLRNALKHYDDRDMYAYDGMTLVRKGGSFGFLDEKGLETVPCQYEDALHFSDDFACVKMDGKWGMVDRNGRTALPFESEVPSYYAGGIVIIRKHGKYGAVNIKGDVVIPFDYDYISQQEGRVLFVRKGKSFRLFSSDGKDLNNVVFDYVETAYVPFGIEGNRLMVSGGSYNKEFLDSAVKSNPRFFGEKPDIYSIVKRNNRLGYIWGGKLTVPCITEEIRPVGRLSQERFGGRPKALMAKIHGKWGVFHAESGSIIIPMKYDTIDYRDFVFLVGEGVLGKMPDTQTYFYKDVVIPEVVGAIGYDGSFLIPLEYNWIIRNSDINSTFYSAIKIDGKATPADIQYINGILNREYFWWFFSEEEYNAHILPLKKKANPDLRFFEDKFYCSVDATGKCDVNLVSRTEFYRGEKVKEEYYGHYYDDDFLSHYLESPESTE